MIIPNYSYNSYIFLFGNSWKHLETVLDFSRWSMVDGRGVGRPGAGRAMQFQIDETTGHPAGLGPWLPYCEYSESKPAARARGGHPLAPSPRPSG